MAGSVSFAYPLMLDLSGRTVVIVGGGSVAARKARGLIEAGAGRVRVVAPEFAAELPEGVERVAGVYEPMTIEGAWLVFAATDRPEVNAAVVRDAKRLGVFVNRADESDEAPGDFSTPAVLREGQLTVTVSAGGSPAIAAAVRDRLRERMDAKWVRIAEVANEYRPYLIARGAAAEIRRAIFRDLASDEAMDVLEARGREGLSEWLKDRHPGL